MIIVDVVVYLRAGVLYWYAFVLTMDFGGVSSRVVVLLLLQWNGLIDFAGALSTPTTISSTELLSTCVDACIRGCSEIRSVQEKRVSRGGMLERVDLKDLSDPKSALTEADGAAQTAIVDALRREWGPALKIVGEEDDGDTVMKKETTSETLRRDICVDIQEDEQLLIADVTVFVDPLDGTREFVEERLSNCQTLIGVAVRGKAFGGIMGIPFPTGDLSKEATIVYGQVTGGYGVINGPILPSNVYSDASRPLLATGDAPVSVMEEARNVVADSFVGTSVLYGGAGNKILATATGMVDCTIQHKFGGPWDTCAAEAVLRSMGGQITDLLGRELVVHQSDAPEYANQLGFVATGKGSSICHEELTSALKTSPIVRDYMEIAEQ